MGIFDDLLFNTSFEFLFILKTFAIEFFHIVFQFVTSPADVGSLSKASFAVAKIASFWKEIESCFSSLLCFSAYNFHVLIAFSTCFLYAFSPFSKPESDELGLELSVCMDISLLGKSLKLS